MDDNAQLCKPYRHKITHPWTAMDAIKALPGRIVGLVEACCGDLAARGRIEDRDVGVAAHRDRALARIKPHDPRGVAGDEVDISRRRIAAAHDHLGVHDGKPWLHSRIAAGGVVDATADG